MTWPFHNYTSQIEWAEKKPQRPQVDIKPLPKRDLPAPKQPSKTDRIKRGNSFTNGSK